MNQTSWNVFGTPMITRLDWNQTIRIIALEPVRAAFTAPTERSGFQSV